MLSKIQASYMNSLEKLFEANVPCFLQVEGILCEGFIVVTACQERCRHPLLLVS